MVWFGAGKEKTGFCFDADVELFVSTASSNGTPSASDNTRVYTDTSTSDGSEVVWFDNISITQIGATLALEPESIQTDAWYGSANSLNASYPAAGASLVRPADDVFPGDVTIAGTLTTSGTLHGKIEIIADDNSLSAAQCYGSLNKLNGAETTTLPAAVAGMNVLLYSDDATVKTIAPNGNDHIWLNGVDNGATNSINSPAAVGDYIVLVAFSANNWYSIGQSGTWIDTP